MAALTHSGIADQTLASATQDLVQRQGRILRDEREQPLSMIPRPIKAKGTISIDNDLLRSSPDPAAILKREVQNIKIQIERQMPPVKVAVIEPMAMADFSINPTTDPYTLSEQRYIDVPAQIDPQHIQVKLVENLSYLVGSPETTSTLSNIVTQTVPFTTTGAFYETIGTSDFSISTDYTNTTFEVTIDGSHVVYHTDYISEFSKQFISKTAIIKRAIKQQLLIRRGNDRRNVLNKPHDPAEVKARETLRDMITEADWRRYLTNGFIMVKGQSGRYWYQIFPHKNVQVYEKGKRINSICIHSDAECPPTDHVINMKVLAEVDESALWRGGNVHQSFDHHSQPIRLEDLTPGEKKRNLVEIYREAKGAA